MIPIRSNQLTGLEWRQPGALSREYELRGGDSIFARLVWLKMFGTLASAETAGANWTFKRTGFLTSVITARVTGSETDIAYYEPNWSGTKGQLHVSRWRSTFTSVAKRSSACGPRKVLWTRPS